MPAAWIRAAPPGAGTAQPAAPTRLPENNTLFKARMRSFVQFTYIHKSVYGSSAFA
jgi:hypothetical protein